MNVFLIGMPGSGKSTVGKKLAALLELPFHDLDDLITDHCQKDIPNIFHDHGESYFRQTEAELLRTTTAAPSVIATGGGAPCFHGNMEWMNNNGITVFLEAPDEMLIDRLSKAGPGERPLVDEHGDVENYIEKLKKERLPFYRQALHIIPLTGADPIGDLFQLIRS